MYFYIQLVLSLCFSISALKLAKSWDNFWTLDAAYQLGIAVGIALPIFVIVHKISENKKAD